MNSLLRKLHTRFLRRRPSGQSIVEFIILLPVLLIMISGLIEFGFMLNAFMDLSDAARAAARQAADDDPVHDVNNLFNDSPSNTPEPAGFYIRIQNAVYDSLASGGQVTLDSTRDNIIVSAFRIQSGNVTARYPSPYSVGGYPVGGSIGWKLWPWNPENSYFTSNAQIESELSGQAPASGVIVVELYYHYDMVLALPWITAFVPNPVLLHAFSIMPNLAVAP